jgi:hypothetical protein
MGWDIAVCVLDGFADGKNAIDLWWGMPRWALLGVVVPWVVMLGVNYWFGLRFVVADDLSRDDVPEIDSQIEEARP